MTGIVKVAGLWELGWSAPYTEFDLWETVIREFLVNEWIMSPVTGIKKGKLIEVENIKDVISSNKNLTTVYVDERGTTNLKDFVHPENALYVLGKVSFSPFLSLNNKNITSVKIETPGNTGLLWPHQAISLVLYDRMVKQWLLQ